MSELNNILVVMPVTSAQKQRLESASPHSRFIFRDETSFYDSAEAGQLLAEADAIIGFPPPRLLPGLKRLQWLQLYTAGANRYVEFSDYPRQVILTNASGAYGLAISEHMVGMVFSLLKKLHLYRDQQFDGHWQDAGAVTKIEGTTTLIVGFGDIGSAFAAKMKALGSHVIGIRRHQSSRSDLLDEQYLPHQLDEVLPRADIVALALPENQETRGLFDRERLLRMKAGSVLLNVGRGSAIDSSALCDVLAQGHLAGAGLDVTEPEPLPPEHPLWRQPNALITPHVSGGFHLAETGNRIIEIAARNLQHWHSGETLRNIVDFSTGYRTFRDT
ncbi:MAG: D-2-hydroxyacid dehydrogenase [Eubacteriales bacterium]|nr:D-2-hydroxyacid dehydrogenase [Eubacteriales bacterium]MDD4461234.1 D-2-hydroxyacid dehydrogenase [Eubacteriales bacterium]